MERSPFLNDHLSFGIGIAVSGIYWMIMDDFPGCLHVGLAVTLVIFFYSLRKISAKSLSDATLKDITDSIHNLQITMCQQYDTQLEVLKQELVQTRQEVIGVIFQQNKNLVRVKKEINLLRDNQKPISPLLQGKVPNFPDLTQSSDLESLTETEIRDDDSSLELDRSDELTNLSNNFVAVYNTASDPVDTNDPFESLVYDPCFQEAEGAFVDIQSRSEPLISGNSPFRGEKDSTSSGDDDLNIPDSLINFREEGEEYIDPDSPSPSTDDDEEEEMNHLSPKSSIQSDRNLLQIPPELGRNPILDSFEDLNELTNQVLQITPELEIESSSTPPGSPNLSETRRRSSSLSLPKSGKNWLNRIPSSKGKQTKVNLREAHSHRKSSVASASPSKDLRRESLLQAHRSHRSAAQKETLHRGASTLRSSRSFLQGSSDKLLFSVTVVLPFGGSTMIDCFQDAPQSEIMEMLWAQLKLDPKSGPSPQKFATLAKMLMDENFVIMDALFSSVDGREKDLLVHYFIELTDIYNRGLDFVKYAIDLELKQFNDSANSLFRGNCWTTILIAAYFRYYSQAYLINLLHPVLKKKFQNPLISQPSSPEESHLVEDALIQFIGDIFNVISNAVREFPSLVKQICKYLFHSVNKKFPDQQYKVLAGFLFLRLICPLLISDCFFEIEPTVEWKKNLIKVTKLLQVVANQSSVNEYHCRDPSQIVEYQQKVQTVLEHFTDTSESPNSKTQVKIESSEGTSRRTGTRSREVIGTLNEYLLRDLQKVMKTITEDNPNDISDRVISSLIDVCGYPLGDRKDYHLKITTSDYYLTSGEFRPLIDSPILSTYFTRPPFHLHASLTLVEKEQCRIEKRLGLQLGCLLERTHLPSWEFTSAEINHFRTTVIDPLRNQSVKLLPQPVRRIHLNQGVRASLPEQVVIKIHLPQDHGTKSLVVSPLIETDALMEELCRKVKHSQLIPHEHWFQLVGLQQYVFESLPLADIQQIYENLSRRRSVQLRMVPRDSVEYVPPNPSLQDNKKQSGGGTKQIIPNRSYPKGIEVYTIEEATKEPNEPFQIIIEHLSHVDLSSSAGLISPGGGSGSGTNGILNTSSGGGGAGGRGITNTNEPELYVEAELYHSNTLLCPPIQTHPAPLSALVWQELLTFSIPLVRVPLESRVCFTVYLVPSQAKSTPQPIGWVAHRVFDYSDCLEQGAHSLGLWNDSSAKANPIGTCQSNPDPSPKLSVKFPRSVPAGKGLLARVQKPPISPFRRIQFLDDIESPNEVELALIKQLIHSDPLCQHTNEELSLLFRARESYVDQPRGLFKFLLSVSWTDSRSISEAYRLMEVWAKPEKTLDVLELLGEQYEDTRVRDYAVKILDELSDDELEDYMLQLVQVLKHERLHHSSLASMLLNRTLANPGVIGVRFFWALVAEMGHSEVRDRFGLVLETFLRLVDDQTRNSFLKQREFIQTISSITGKVVEEKSRQQKTELLQSLLQSTPIPSFHLPFDFSIITKELQREKCKAMDSAQSPIYLSFTNQDPAGSPVAILFKSGDDLRQDMLTLQMITIMSKMWLEHGLDLQMTPYRCLVTGDTHGLIEIVPNSVTTADIHKRAAGVRGAFVEASITNWLSSMSKTPKEFAEAKENFIRSCAGYCVATFILGIGDRHNDNIMVSPTGHLFHIDFGHFLGNWQTWKGFKRDRTPFVFTREFAHVMGGRSSPDYERFCLLCCTAYNILRKHAYIFINLFTMMLSTGMPELKNVSSLRYLHDAFALDKTNQEAAVFFRGLIVKSLNTTATRVNNALHILVHPT